MTNLNVVLFPQTRENRLCYLTSQPTHIEVWGFSDLEPENEIDEAIRPRQGVIVSCIDGSLYIFRSSLAKVTKSPSSSEKRLLYSGGDHLHPTLPYRRPHLSFSKSRNSSPAGSRTNLAVSSTKSRAVSGLTKEQVEAPKNFVDFEDEQERMKGMIAERSVKEVKDRSRRSSLTPPPVSSHRPDDARSLASVESGSSILSPPLSPTLGPVNETSDSTCRDLVSLRIRIIPNELDSEISVVSLKLLHKGKLFLTLHSSGKVSVFKTEDGTCVTSISPGSSFSTRNARVLSHGYDSQILWSWCALHVNQVGDNLLIAAIARASDATVSLDSGESDDKTRIILYEIAHISEYETGSMCLCEIGDHVLKGRAESLSISMDNERIIKIYQVNDEAMLSVHNVTHGTSDVNVPLNVPSQEKLSEKHIVQALPQQLRNLVTRPDQSSSTHENSEECPDLEIQKDPTTWELPLTSTTKGLNIQVIDSVILGVVWSANELIVFELQNDDIDMRCAFPISGDLINIKWLDSNTIRLQLPNKVDTYLLPTTKTSGSPLPDEATHRLSTKLVSSVALPSNFAVCLGYKSSDPLIYIAREAREQKINVLRPSIKKGFNPLSKCIWSSNARDSTHNARKHRVTSLLPINASHVVIGSNDGNLRKSSLKELINSHIFKEPTSSPMSNFSLLSLRLVSNKRTKKSFVIAGGDDGSINIWDLSSLKLHARWVVFIEPLQNVFQVEKQADGRLRDCCLCVSRDGTIAVIEIDGFNFLFLVPGSPAHLRTICLSTDNLMLLYVDGRTRLWDIKNREFWRSMNSEKTAEMLEQGGWSILHLENDLNDFPKASLFPMNKASAEGDPPPACLFEVQPIIEDFHHSKVTSEELGVILASLLTTGLDDQVDRLLAVLLGHTHRDSNAIYGAYDSFSSCQIFATNSPRDLWRISPDVTALKLLAVTSLLRALLDSFAGGEGLVGAVMSFYTTELPAVVGSDYQSPSLAILAQFWCNSTVSEIRFSAKQLFENEVSRSSDEFITSIINKWKHELPCLLPGDDKQTSRAALALCICGNIATERYSLLSSSTLSDIAKSMMIYFNDDLSPHRALAIDLCSRGFEIWQQYFDAMEALRSLFTLATTSKKESINVRNPGPQARLAVLHIASSNSPLFMTTLSLDILHPRSIEYSKSVLQIIAFLIRKNPLVLFPNLPRLMEAVVKSLDPSSNANREAVQDSVTDIIALVVHTFPTLDFHAGTQRLAVGTNEGAVILYDLRTATRLYVLEGHRKRLSGISFSPDGRRMVTLSVQESVVLVWKVGSGFSSFFNPGAPPRQGRSGSEPFKTLNFVLQDQNTLSIEDSLKQVKFEWPSDRSVKVQIRDTTFTFST